MGLVTCPICTKGVSAEAPTCPNCGHPIAKQKVGQASRPIIIQHRTGSAFAGVLIVILLLGGIGAAVTKPNESALKNALLEKYGVIYGAGMLAEKIGLMNVRYHDYIVFSTLSVQLGFEPERTIAYGFFAKTVVPNVSLSQSTTTAPTQPIAETTSTGLGVPAGNPPSPRNLSETLRSEMLNASVAAARQKHPASNFIGNGCAELALDVVNATGDATQYAGVYRCTMKGAILGLSQYDFRVRVTGETRLQNGSIVNRITSSQLIN